MERLTTSTAKLGAKPLDPLRERLTSVATIHPQDAEPSEPAQDPAQDHLRAVAFGGVGRGHGHAEHQPQGVHQQMSLAAFDPFASVIAHPAAMTVGLDALAVENGRRWSGAFALSFTDERAQHIVEDGPLVIADPLPKDMIDGLPRRKVGGQITPRATTLDDMQEVASSNLAAPTIFKNCEDLSGLSPQVCGNPIQENAKIWLESERPSCGYSMSG